MGTVSNGPFTYLDGNVVYHKKVSLFLSIRL